MESPLALYRRYRPETFAEVIGQEHVTEPLRAALGNNRVNHAYLFSGPRGCGKTTSARILARALNCERAPVSDPCGECESCRDLARNGPGSIDVIEIDAASHGGVDDARDLREKAFFAPVRSRYKVYIIDEAHMVTTQGFNALLKLVEEPPPHLRFIFATTEPEKVIPTIRSRTHHYPFRLFPPKLVADYIAGLCEQEQIAVEAAVLPLVARAGAGSMRDSLSVMDQLLSGAGPEGVTYQLATGLLGYTPDTLLDEVVDAFAAGDGSTVFGVVDKIIETGQDPRRFTEDLLRRLRDLVIIAAVPDAPATGLIDVSADQGERLVAQASRFGRADLSRAADLVATGLTEMRGATAPRLLLELICARVLLPGADHSTHGVQARLDRLERRVSIGGVPAEPTPAAAAGPAAEPQVSTPPSSSPEPIAPAPAVPEPAPLPKPPPESTPLPTPPPESMPLPTPPAPQAGPSRVADAPAEPAESASAPEPAGNGLTLVDVRRLWPDIIEATKQRRRITWIHLSQNAQVVAVEGSTLTLGFANGGARDSFETGGSPEIVRQAVIDVIGADFRIETIIDPGADATAGLPAATREPAVREPERRAPEPAVPEPPRQQAPPDDPPPWATDEPESASPDWAAPDPDQPERVSGRDALRQVRTDQDAPEAPPRDPDADASPDDLDADSEALGTDDLLARELGAQVIEEIPHQ
ncbi:DNA polymerase III subunit gamma and tau [Nocardioides sp. GXZ039]|uniref:DNA polymerase III subunit gamma and tau n=1 Tax=Nocardioides sp. GXZ039 TaxID=3136018 RepID=UPI0030F3B4EC